MISSPFFKILLALYTPIFGPAVAFGIALSTVASMWAAGIYL